jgi:hypothetical protein
VIESRLQGQGSALRLFLTVWLVYALHATTNVARETYLTISLGTDFTTRVDRYLGLHPDLFEIPGRGGYINNNPGVSMLAAVPYAILVRPAIALAVWLRPSLAQPKPPAAYDDPRPNRTKFMNAARERGLDIVLGLAAIGTQVTFMAPLGALGALLMFFALRARLENERAALWWALAYAFATPLLFRSGFLNQNAAIAHCVLGAFLAIVGVRPRANDAPVPRGALFLAGLLLGTATVCDYSGVPFVLVFGGWIAARAWRLEGAAGAARAVGWYALGGLGPLAVLLAYQWAAFGSPIWPAQRYMPSTRYSVRGWFGFTLPTRELLIGNLFDPRYGLLVFCPMLAAGFAAPFLRARPGSWWPSRAEIGWITASVVALYIFSSANQYANLQWNTGVRYLVPAVPLLFFPLVAVMRRLPMLVVAPLVVASLVISWCVSMTREDIPTAIAIVFREGLTLPVLLVLRKMASGYEGLQLPAFTGWLVYALLALVLWLLWKSRRVSPGSRSGGTAPAAA